MVNMHGYAAISIFKPMLSPNNNKNNKFNLQTTTSVPL